MIQVDEGSSSPPDRRMPHVAVVVLNWNRRADTVECLDSLLRQNYANAQLIVVDNGSTDDSVMAIHSAFPEVTVLVNSTNLGFGEGNNVGIQYALTHGADYVLLLNNDTVVDSAVIDHLVRVIQTDDRIGAVGAKILFHDFPHRLWSAGGIINYAEGVARLRGYRQFDRGQFDCVEEVDCVPGCAMLLRQQAVERVGLFDPLYSPAYLEDSDWCMRAHQQGYRIMYAPAAKVWHKVSMSGGGEYNVRERYLIGYNSVLFMKRYATPRNWFTFFILAVLSLPPLYMVRLFQGRGRGVLVKGLGIWDGLRGRRREKFIR